jgi:hypothetical protein
MGVKVQYNPSTGKVSYNPATGKVQVVVGPTFGTCADCDNPDEIKVTISGVTVCCAKITDFPDDQRFKLTPLIMDTINGEHILGKTSDCHYERVIVIDTLEGTAHYINGDCEGDPFDFFALFSIRIRLEATVLGNLSILLEINQTSFAFRLNQRWQEPLTLPCYDQTLTASSPISKTDCDDEHYVLPQTTAMINGTVVVERVP